MLYLCIFSTIKNNTNKKSVCFTSWKARHCHWKKKFEDKFFKNLFFSLCYPQSTHKIIKFGTAASPARGNIYTNVLCYYIDNDIYLFTMFIYIALSTKIYAKKKYMLKRFQGSLECSGSRGECRSYQPTKRALRHTRSPICNYHHLNL